MEYSTTERGGTVLLYKGHEYLQKRMKQDGVIYWRCRQYFKNKCPSTLVTSYDDIVKEPGTHCHVGDCIQVTANATVAKMRDRAYSCKETTRNILGVHLVNVDENVLARMPKRSTLERNIRRRRQNGTAAVVGRFNPRTIQPRTIQPRTIQPTGDSTQDDSTHGRFNPGTIQPADHSTRGRFNPRTIQPADHSTRCSKRSSC
ncbi:uncharacterized protein LOC143460026 [Clavelina lepadiformis]|uniref:uncharacterized protein LOC143460026 n=1 Tax=Clavelina lepadiformis TaxID=159417 RepID=UPI0040411DAE